jgi:hypothetical protein
MGRQSRIRPESALRRGKPSRRPRECLLIVCEGQQTEPNYFPILAPRIPQAIENSKQIHRSQWRETPRSIDCNPGTTVHELVERLMEVAGMTIEEYQARFPIPDTKLKKRTRPRR